MNYSVLAASLIAGVGVFILVRNELVNRIVQARIDEVHRFNQAMIKAGRFEEQLPYDMSRQYTKLVFNLKVWRLRDVWAAPGAEA